MLLGLLFFFWFLGFNSLVSLICHVCLPHWLIENKLIKICCFNSIVEDLTVGI